MQPLLFILPHLHCHPKHPKILYMPQVKKILSWTLETLIHTLTSFTCLCLEFKLFMICHRQ